METGERGRLRRWCTSESYGPKAPSRGRGSGCRRWLVVEVALQFGELGDQVIDPLLQRAIDAGSLAGGPGFNAAAKLESDGATKIPSVRNAALTPPYFSYGGYATLRQVMKFSDTVHFSEGHLTRRYKEMIASYVSYLNRCPY